MARTFITSGEGSQQTLSDIQSEKIPIYDTEQDAENDLANLEEGQIVGTKESKFDVDDMKDYIRKQNVLSDYEDFAITTTNQEMEWDGVIICSFGGTNEGSILYVNDVMIAFHGTGTNSNSQSSITACFRKGDNIRYRGTLQNSKVAYYKLRDYTDR